MKLNLGGNEEYDGGPGSPKLIGFTHVDARQMPGVHVICDIRNLPDKWLNRCREIRVSHVIEHMPYDDASLAVKHWASMLKIGGMLRIYCPNFRKLAFDLSNESIDIDEFSRNVFGNQTYALNLHRAAYDQGKLNGMVKAAGLKIVGEKPRPFAYAYDLGVQCIRVQ
jgi:predicted SAM-dependent methyltransferase